jgi:(p)ppGpp synthase/HD superfamily hydrolase
MMNEVFEKALRIAIEAHSGQVDKLGKPYILHPLAVASQLDSLELKVVALLHDTIEDTDTTAEELVSKGIPEELVKVVEILTNKKDKTYEDYLRHIKTNPMAVAVKRADLAHNTSPERAMGLNERRRAKYELAQRILSE